MVGSPFGFSDGDGLRFNLSCLPVLLPQRNFGSDH